MKSKLEELHQCAIHSVMARTSEANTASASIRMGELHSLHVAAFMNINKTTESLQHILKYKKELALEMLRCSDEKRCEELAELIKYSDSLINKILGMYVP